MQRSIKSFFQPKVEAVTKKEKELDEVDYDSKGKKYCNKDKSSTEHPLKEKKWQITY